MRLPVIPVWILAIFASLSVTKSLDWDRYNFESLDPKEFAKYFPESNEDPATVAKNHGEAPAPSDGPYEPNWKSIDSRPLPEWYDDAKIGIFMHWGVFSVPSYISEWFWNYWHNGNKDIKAFMKAYYPPNFTYADFAPMFKAELFNPNEWAKLFEKSGAKYVVLTSKHHEGFCNWKTKYSFNWNSVAVGPKRDLVGELAKAVKETDVKFGLYHSLFEWFNPLFLQDSANKFQTNHFVRGKTYPELIELVKNYEPDVIWSDGDPAPSWYWNSTVFLAWLYNESPVKDTVCVNDRWGYGTSQRHGGYYSGPDRWHPDSPPKHKWESAFTLDPSSWGLNRLTPVENLLSIQTLLNSTVKTVAYGGNALINVGPSADGRIIPIFQERLLQMGKWLGVNGEAIYATTFCPHFQTDNISASTYYTCSKKDPTMSFVTFFEWPLDDLLVLGRMKECPAAMKMLGTKGKPLKCSKGPKGIEIDLGSVVEAVTDGNLLWAWSLAFGPL